MYVYKYARNARSTVYKVLHRQALLNKSQGGDHRKLLDERGLSSDLMLQKLNLDKKYQIITPYKKDWEKSLKHQRIRTGIQTALKRNAMEKLGRPFQEASATTVFQTKIAAIDHCVKLGEG